jgi:hypothetical protein
MNTNYIARTTILVILFLAGIGISVAQEPLSKEKTKVFLKTDKDIYAPGENLNFVSRLYDCLYETASTEKELIVMIKGKKGEIIVDQKFTVEDGVVMGELLIPLWASSGMASVVAFTTKNMLNNEAQLVAVHPILINALQKNDFVINLTFEDKIWNPGEEMDIQISMIPVVPGNKKEKVNINLYDSRGELMQLKQTLHSGLNKVKIKIPVPIENGLWVEVESASKNFGYAIAPIRTSTDILKVEFFPEGGQMLANTIQKIVYRATDISGSPITLNGKVYDQSGHHVGVGKSLKPGIGLISLMPMPGQNYVFKIDGSYGQPKEYQLPETHIDGVVLSHLKTENGILKNHLRVVGKYLSNQLIIRATHAGKTVWETKLKAEEENKLDVASNQLPIGVVNFQVLDPSMNVISERMVYNGEPISERLPSAPNTTFGSIGNQITLTADVGSIKKQVPDAVFDVKIIDKHNLFFDYNPLTSSYFQYPLLTPVPQTVLDFYLTNIELIGNVRLSACKNLDVINDASKGKTISGEVVDKKGKPVAGANVVAVLPNLTQISTTTSDKNGQFTIDGIDKSSEIKIKALDSKGKKNYEVRLHHSFQESLDMVIRNSLLRVKSPYDPAQLVGYYEKNRSLLRDYQAENRARNNSQNSNIERMLQSGSSILDVIRMMKSFDIVNNQIVFYGSHNSLNFQSGALIVVDGQKMGTDIGVLNSISPSDVASLSVSTDPMDIQKYTGLNSVGIIEIRTKGSTQSLDIPNVKDIGKSDEYVKNAHAQQTTRFWLPMMKAENGTIDLVFDSGKLNTDFIIQIDAIGTNGTELPSKIIFTND